MISSTSVTTGEKEKEEEKADTKVSEGMWVEEFCMILFKVIVSYQMLVVSSSCSIHFLFFFLIPFLFLSLLTLTHSLVVNYVPIVSVVPRVSQQRCE